MISKTDRSSNHPSGESLVNPRMTLRDWVLLIFLSVIWGGSFYFVGVAVKEVPPFTIVFCRVAIAALVLWVVVGLKKQPLPASVNVWGAFMVLGLLNNVIPFSLIAWGQSHIESGLASILNATSPIFSAVLAHFFTRQEKLTPRRVLGIIIGWLGVAVLFRIQVINGFGVKGLGQAAVLIASVSYALAAVFGTRLKQIPPLVTSAGMLTCSALMTLPVSLVLDRPWHLSPDTGTMAAIFCLAAVSTSLAYLIYFKILATSGPTNILLVTFLIPVSAVFFGWLLLGEHLGKDVFIGMGMIVIGLMVLDGRVMRRYLQKRNRIK